MTLQPLLADHARLAGRSGQWPASINWRHPQRRTFEAGETRAPAFHVVALIVAAAIASPASGQLCPDWTQRLPGTSPSPRSAMWMAYDSGRAVTVLFGGEIPGQRFNDIWEWNGTNWTQRSPATSPSVRSWATMAYDSNRSVTVLFGGYASGSAQNNETWEWNGSNWSLRSSSGPSPRWTHATAYDSTRQVTVLFGGYNGSSDIADTWEWNGASWTQRSPATSPPGHEQHGMVYDSARHVTVLFGGYAGGPSNDTWEWDGTNWTQRSPATRPSARYPAVMAYDSDRGVTVLFGGADNSGSLDDTWEWDGTNWTQRFLTTSPAARTRQAMAYDSVRQMTVLFGGTNAGDVIVNDTWELDAAASTAPSISQQPPSATTVCDGATAMLSITASGSPAPTYQWRTNGSDIGGATADSYTTPVLHYPDDDGNSYDCVVSNTCGSTTSDAAVVTVNPSPAATATNDGPVCEGADVQLIGGPSGMASYAWSGPNGFNSASMSPTVSSAVVGQYCLTVTDANDCSGVACTTVELDETDANSDGTPDCADVERLLHFQGKLRDAIGAAISGTADLTFRFYDAATGGNLLFTESHVGVVVTNGLLSVLLGTQTAGGVPDTALERPDVYISVEVGSGGELSPRSRVPATGYAIKSKAAEQLVKPGTLNPAVTVDAGGNVGIGTDSPQSRLEVDGAVSTGQGGLKWKIFTGIFGSSQNTEIPHGLTDWQKVVSVSGLYQVDIGGGQIVKPQMSIQVRPSVVFIPNTGSVAGQPYSVLLFYTD